MRLPNLDLPGRCRPLPTRLRAPSLVHAALAALLLAVAPPQQLLVVAAPAAGLIEAVTVAPNETVHAGQPIARLRSTDLLEAQRTYLQALSAEKLAAEKLRRDEQMH